MVLKCAKCGFKSDERLDFCGTYKILDGKNICRPCGGAPANKGLEGKYLHYLRTGVGDRINTNDERGKGC